MSTDLEQGMEYELTVTTGYGDQYIKVWIDYNDDLDFTEDEVVVNNHIIAIIWLFTTTSSSVKSRSSL